MPRYHFDVRIDLGLLVDDEGRELDDFKAARKEALKGIRSLISETSSRVCWT